jgi:hypothetical protein
MNEWIRWVPRQTRLTVAVVIASAMLLLAACDDSDDTEPTRDDAVSEMKCEPGARTYNPDVCCCGTCHDNGGCWCRGGVWECEHSDACAIFLHGDCRGMSCQDDSDCFPSGSCVDNDGTRTCS